MPWQLQVTGANSCVPAKLPVLEGKCDLIAYSSNDVKLQSQRGRPNTALIDRLRVVVWSHHVMVASGAQSAEEFEFLFANPTQNISLSKGLWSRYKRGETLPQGAMSGGGRTLIDHLDVLYPGTKDVFFHPIWELLDLDQLLGPEQLKSAFLRMEKDIWNQFVSCIGQSKPNATPKPRTFWPLVLSDAERTTRLGRLRDLDGLAACLIEARMGYLAQSEVRFVNCIEVASQLFEQLAADPVFSNNRMRTALLAMEAKCLWFLTRTTVDEPDDNEAHLTLRTIAREVERHFTHRCEAHLKKLSSSSSASFREWMKLAAGELRSNQVDKTVKGNQHGEANGTARSQRRASP